MVKASERLPIPVSSIPKILDTVKEIGRRGVQIKRFKGLGEMNAKELFSTTMDPTKRKLLQVELNENNAVEADKMFTILMGDVVEPRRAFIEDNASERKKPRCLKCSQFTVPSSQFAVARQGNA